MTTATRTTTVFAALSLFYLFSLCHDLLHPAPVRCHLGVDARVVFLTASCSMRHNPDEGRNTLAVGLEQGTAGIVLKQNKNGTKWGKNDEMKPFKSFERQIYNFTGTDIVHYVSPHPGVGKKEEQCKTG